MTNPNGRGPTRKPQRKIRVEEQIGTGVVAVKFYAEKARQEDMDNPVIAAMAVALLDTVERASPEDEKELRLAVGYTIVAAFLYGQEAGAKIERSLIARHLCTGCERTAHGEDGYQAAVKDEAGHWVHKLQDGREALSCEASSIWEYIEHERTKTDVSSE